MLIASGLLFIVSCSSLILEFWSLLFARCSLLSDHCWILYTCALFLFPCCSLLFAYCLFMLLSHFLFSKITYLFPFSFFCNKNCVLGINLTTQKPIRRRCFYPVDTRRRFNVYKTSIGRRRRRIDVL